MNHYCISNKISRQNIYFISIFLFLFIAFKNEAQNTITSGLFPTGVPSVMSLPVKKGAEPELKAKVAQWMNVQSVNFLENKGQMMDERGNPVSNVLFKAAMPGMDMYITKSGLTYGFMKISEEEKMANGIVNKIKEEDEFKVEYCRIDVVLKDANIQEKNIITEGPVHWVSNYYLGHCPEGIENVHAYKKVIIKDVYPGIDWVLYHTIDKGLKYDFIVHPGADPHNVELVYSSLDPILMNRDGSLEVNTRLGSLTEKAPVSYQNEKEIETHFVKSIDQRNVNGGYYADVRFAIPHYDATQILTIDPQLIWSTYFITGTNNPGGAAGPLEVEVDASGNVFVAGYTFPAPAFPTLNAGGTTYYQGAFAGGGEDGIISKFSSTGALLWSTFYGGSTGVDEFYGLDIDAVGNIYLTGRAGSTDFPVINPGGGAYFDGVNGGANACVLKFNNSGTRIWSTFFGGNGNETGFDINVDNLGNIFITGTSTSTAGFPFVNPGGGAYFDNTYNGTGFNNGDVFVSKFNPAMSLVWSTYFGGSNGETGRGITTDANGNVFVAGSVMSADFPTLNPGGGAFFDNTYGGGGGNGYGDMFALKFTNSGVWTWGTYIGGSSEDLGTCITEDNFGNIFIAGQTASGNFPVINPGGGAYFDNTVNGSYDLCVLKFSNSGVMLWSTYYGGSSDDISYYGQKIKANSCGDVVVGGMTRSTNFPTQTSTCTGYFDNSFNGGFSDGYIVLFNNSGVRLWATYWGTVNGFTGSFTDDFVRAVCFSNDNISLYAVGEFQGPSGPTMDPGGGAFFNAGWSGTLTQGTHDAFIAKFKPAPVTLTTSFNNNTSACSCNGTATATLNCGTSFYNYSWSNGSQTLNSSSSTNAISNLCPGTYTVTATSSCTVLTSIVTIIGTSGGLATSVSQSNVNCNGKSTGTATVNANGGIGPYTYLWSPGSQTSSTATGLAAGTYSASITDAGGCTSTQIVVITQPPAIVLGFSTQWSCAVNSGTSTINVANGSSPYTYLWNTGQTTQTVTGLAQGSYTATVTDSKGCTQTQTVNITLPPSMNLTPASVATTCAGSNGSAGVTVSGNSGPVSYSWSPGGQVAVTATGLSAGTYTVLVTDVNGCTKTATVNVASSTGPTATFTQSPTGTVCLGTNVTFTNTGSTGTYNWLVSPANVSGSTVNFSYTFLSTGSYTISHTVTSAGCSKQETSTVNVINCTSGPSVTAAGSSVCPGSCGTVTASGTGGTSPYTYNWSNGATTQNINPCPASTTTYTVTIRDTGGGTSTSTAVVTVNPAISVSATSTNLACNGTANGSSSANPANGTAPYTYSWSNGQTAPTATGLGAGTYTVTITDASGCSSIANAVIISPAALTGQFTKGTANCSDCGCKEWLMVTASGGTIPYSYTWPDGYTNRYKNHICPGSYTINVTDKNGCSINVSIITP